MKHDDVFADLERRAETAGGQDRLCRPREAVKRARASGSICCSIRVPSRKSTGLLPIGAAVSAWPSRWSPRVRRGRDQDDCPIFHGLLG